MQKLKEEAEDLKKTETRKRLEEGDKRSAEIRENFQKMREEERKKRNTHRELIQDRVCLYGWMDGWMDGYVCVFIYVCVHVNFLCADG